MSPLSLLLVAAILLVDGGYDLTLSWAVREPWLVLFLAFGPACLAVILNGLACRFVHARIVDNGDLTGVRRLAWCLRLTRHALILNALFVILVMDWMAVVREVTGNLILLDELIVIAPVLLGSLLMARTWYPIDRAMSPRSDSGIRHGAWRFAWGQLCMELLLMLVPALLVIGVLEVTQTGLVHAWGDVAGQCLLLGGVVVVFLATPYLMRLFLALKPMESGELRDRLQLVCLRHRVRIREILLWRTGGLILNAAVVGLTGRLRYIVFTESLVHTLPEDYTEAVMAHEVAHVRHAHIPWMFASIVCLILMIEVLISALPEVLADDVWIQLGLMIAAIWMCFGWISRRFERQADAFAAVHMSQPTGEGSITLQSIATVTNALKSIASLNGAAANRYSWRHGSTAWRCRNLYRMADCPLSSIPADRIVFRIKLAIVLIGSISISILVSSSSGVST